MTRVATWLLGTGLTVALLVGGARLFPHTARAVGLDVTDLPSLFAIVAEAKQVDVGLMGKTRTTLKRIEARSALLDELAAGRVSLQEAAERFHQLNVEAALEHPEVRPVREHAAEDQAEVYREIAEYLMRRPPRDGEDTSSLLLRLEMAQAETRR